MAPITGLAAGRGHRRPTETRLAAGGVRLDDCGAVIVRAIPAGSLEQVIFRLDALHRLTRLGVAVINSPRCIERTVDKYFTSTLLEDAGLPTPRTRVCERLDDALAAFEALGGDVVIKPLFGSEGRGIVRVSDPDLAYRTCRALELTRSVFYLQEFVPHGGRDIRAFVVGGRLVAAMTRWAAGWKTNVSQGARTEPVVLSGELERLSVQAAGLLEADYAGVDLLCADDGRVLVIEVNGIPGWRGLQQTTDVDVAGAIAEHAIAAVGARPSGRRLAVSAPRPGPDPPGAPSRRPASRPPRPSPARSRPARRRSATSRRPAASRDARFDDFALSAQALGRRRRRRRAGAGGPDRLPGGGRHRARGPVQHQPRHGAPVRAPRGGRAGAAGGRGSGGGSPAVLRGLSVDDARWAYRAIRLARPGGLGRSDEAPVARPPVDHAAGGHAAGRAARHRGGGVRPRLHRHVRPGARQASPGARVAASPCSTPSRRPISS